MASTNDVASPTENAQRWQVLGRRTIYSSWWVQLHVDSVRLNDGRTIDHEVVIAPQESAGMVVVNDHLEVLMIFRHRFIPDTWGWELPAGLVEPGESPRDAATRECLEESGHLVSGVQPLASWYPSSGFSNQRFHAFLARSVVRVEEPTEQNEAVRVEWRPMDLVARDLVDGSIPDGFAHLALLRALAQLGIALPVQPTGENNTERSDRSSLPDQQPAHDQQPTKGEK